jgi:hypothetical protein
MAAVVIGTVAAIDRAHAAAAAQGSDRSPATIAATAGVLARLDRLRTVSAHLAFQERFHHDSPSSSKPVGRGISIPSRDRDGEMIVDVLDGRGRWETRWSTASAAQLGITRDITVFNGDRVEMFVARKSLSGMILAGAPVPPSLLEIALGTRPFDWPAPAPAGPSQRPWLSAEQIRAMVVSIDGSGNAVFEWSAPNKLTYRWTYRPEVGYVMVRCDIVTTQGQLRFAEVIPGDFREVDGLTVPFAVCLRQFRPRDGFVVYEKTANVQLMSLADPRNRPELYAMRWPKGMVVTDARTKTRIKVEQDDFVITDDYSVRVTAQQSYAGATPGSTQARGIPVAVVADGHRRLGPMALTGVFLVVSATITLCVYVAAIIGARRRRFGAVGSGRDDNASGGTCSRSNSGQPQ